MGFKILCIFVLLKKVALALEGLRSIATRKPAISYSAIAALDMSTRARLHKKP